GGDAFVLGRGAMKCACAKCACGRILFDMDCGAVKLFETSHSPNRFGATTMPKDIDQDRELPDKKEFVGKKTVAGICGILLGAFGVHKFVLGKTKPGIIMLILGITCCLSPVSSIIGLIEGIIYLTKSDDDFYQQYAVDNKEWF